MWKNANDTQDLRFLEQNRELILRRLSGNEVLDIQTGKVRQRITDDNDGKIVFERLDKDTV